MATKEEALQALDVLREFIDGIEDTGSPAAGEAITVPTSEEFGALSKDEILDLAQKLGINVEGQKSSAVKLLVSTLVKVAADEEADEDEVNDLAETLQLTPDKKVEKTIEAIKEWIAALGTAGEASTEGEEPAAAEEGSEAPAEESSEGGEPPAEEGATEGDNVDRAEVAAAVKKLPDTKTMIAHLKAYNAKAEDNGASKIEFNEKVEKTVKEGYRSLLAELVDSASEVSAWGVAYFRDGGAWCCGLPLADNAAVFKKTKKQAGTCVVTGKVFVLNEDESPATLDEYKK